MNGLELAREIAVELCKQNGTANADQVGKMLEDRHGIKSLGASAGSLFKGSQFEFTGQRVVSRRIKNHGREIKVWKLNER